MPTTIPPSHNPNRMRRAWIACLGIGLFRVDGSAQLESREQNSLVHDLQVSRVADEPKRDSLRAMLDLRAYVLGLDGAHFSETSNLASLETKDFPLAHRALFCRLDDALDRRSVPLRIRLGDLETVNRAERKPGFR